MNTAPATYTVSDLANTLTQTLDADTGRRTHVFDLATGQRNFIFQDFIVRTPSTGLDLTFHAERTGLITPILNATLPALLDPYDNSNSYLAIRYLPTIHILAISVFPKDAL